MVKTAENNPRNSRLIEPTYIIQLHWFVQQMSYLFLILKWFPSCSLHCAIQHPVKSDEIKKAVCTVLTWSQISVLFPIFQPLQTIHASRHKAILILVQRYFPRKNEHQIDNAQENFKIKIMITTKTQFKFTWKNVWRSANYLLVIYSAHTAATERWESKTSVYISLVSYIAQHHKIN